MYSVSNDYLTAIKSNVRDLTYTLTITGLDSFLVNEIIIDRQNSKLIGNAISQKITLKLKNIPSTTDFTGKEINVSIGLLVNGDYEFVPFPTFTTYIQECSFDIESKEWTITAYDKLFNCDKFTFNDINNLISYPITRLGFLQIVLNKVGIDLGNADFLWNDTIIPIIPNIENTATLRYVIQVLAEACLSNAYIGRDNKLYLKQLINTDTIYNTGDNYSKLVIGNSYGEVNRVVLERSPQNDDIYAEVVAEDDDTTNVTEFHIVDNPFLDYTTDDTSRLLYVNNILSVLSGFITFSYNFNYRGNPALDIFDKVTVTDVSDNTNKTILYAGDTITFNGGLSAESNLEIDSQEAIDITKAATVKNTLMKTQLYVDKVNGDIVAQAERITALESDLSAQITALNETVINATEGMTNTFKISGGANLLRNTAPYFAKDYNLDGEGISWEYWEQSGSLKRILSGFSISGYALLLQNGSISQSVNLSKGKYVTSFGYSIAEGGSLTCYINGQRFDLSSNESEFELPHTFNDSIIYNIQFVTNINNGAEVYDLMLNLGNEKIAWTQNANETVSDTVNISQGISVKNSATGTITKIDADGMTVTDSSSTEVLKTKENGIETKSIKANSGNIGGLFIQAVDGEVWLSAT